MFIGRVSFLSCTLYEKNPPELTYWTVGWTILWNSTTSYGRLRRGRKKPRESLLTLRAWIYQLLTHLSTVGLKVFLKLEIGKDSMFSFCFTCQQNTYVCNNRSKKITLMKNLKKLSEIDNLGSLWALAVFGIKKLTRIGKAHRRIFSNMTNQGCFVEKMIAGDWEWKITLKEFFFHACCSTIQVFS